MKIETKYNIGDKVWLIAKNEIVQLEIQSVSPYYCRSFQYIKYGFGRSNYTNLFDLFEEEKLFPTKEELLKSL